MEATTRPPPLAAPPIGPAQEKGRPTLACIGAAQEDSAPASLRVWVGAGQEPTTALPMQELRFRWVDLRDERERLDQAAKDAAEESRWFTSILTEAAALAYVTSREGFDRVQLCRAVFGRPDLSKEEDALVSLVLETLQLRGFLAQQQGVPITQPRRWVCGDVSGATETLGQIRRLIADCTAVDAAEGAADE